MPTYEYRCNACQRELEIEQRMSDPDLVKCEACGEDKLEKLISWAAFGSGSASTQALYSGGNKKEAIRSSLDKGRPPKKDPKPEPASIPTATSDAPTAPMTPASIDATIIPDADRATVADTDDTKPKP